MDTKYSTLNLKDNPFKDLTPSIVLDGDQNVPWAGMGVVKKRIEDVYHDASEFSPRQIVLNWGPYGGGKTFSAYYFIKEFSSEKLIHAYIRCPKDGNLASDELFKNVVDFISFRQLRLIITNLRDKIGEEALFNLINRRIRSEEFTNAILKLASDDEEIIQIMQRYLYSGVTKTELKKLGIPRQIESEIDEVKFLAGLILCIIGTPDDPNKFVLWIDEMEDLVYYSQKNYKSFSQVLRDLFDTLNDHFTVFLNFTLAEPEESTVELLLGSAVWSRITTKIRYKELSIDDGMEYCSDLITSFQIRKSKDLNPFTRDTIGFVLRLIPEGQITPREINRRFGDILNFALKSGAERIDLPLAKEWTAQLQNED